MYIASTMYSMAKANLDSMRVQVSLCHSVACMKLNIKTQAMSTSRAQPWLNPPLYENKMGYIYKDL